MDTLDALREIKALADKQIQRTREFLPQLDPLLPLGKPFPIDCLPRVDTTSLESRLKSLGVPASSRRSIASLLSNRLSTLEQNFCNQWVQSVVPVSDRVVAAVASEFSRLQIRAIDSVVRTAERCLAKPSFNSEYVPFFEKYFEFNAYPSLADRQVMARKSMMTTRQIEVWFQNRRAKAKKEGLALRRMKPSDPPPDWRSLEDLKQTMKHFYIPETERSTKEDFDEAIPAQDSKSHLSLATPFNNPLNPPDVHPSANASIPQYRNSPSPDPDFAFTYTFRTCTKSPSAAPSFRNSNLHQAMEDLSATFMSLSLLTSKPRSFDSKAATAAFSYDCSRAPHCAMVTMPQTMPPLDLQKTKVIRQPSWRVPHVESSPVLPPRVDAPVVSASSLTQKARKRAPLPRRAAPCQSTSPSGPPSLSHSRRSSFASSSVSSSAPSTPEQFFPSLPVAIAQSVSSQPVRSSFGAFASQKSLLVEKIEQHKCQQVPTTLDPPPYCAHHEDAMSYSWDHMFNSTPPALPLSNGLHHQIHPRIPFDHSQPLYSFSLPSPASTIQEFSLFSGTDFSTPPSNLSLDIPDLFNFDAELGNFMGTLLSRGDIPPLDGGLEEPSFDSIVWGTTPQPQELPSADLSAPFLNSSFMPGTAPDLNTLISSY